MYIDSYFTHYRTQILCENNQLADVLSAVSPLIKPSVTSLPPVIGLWTIFGARMAFNTPHLVMGIILQKD